MSPLLHQEVFIGPQTHQIGVFGFTRSSPLKPETVNALAQQVLSTHHLTLQLVDADLVAGPDHLLFATLHAHTAFHNQNNRASTLAMEILRFVAAQRQISEALKRFGISKSTRCFGGVLTNSEVASLKTAYREFLSVVEGTDDLSILEITSAQKEQNIQKAFQIHVGELDAISPSTQSEDRRQALKKLVYDRCALIAIAR